MFILLYYSTFTQLQLLIFTIIHIYIYITLVFNINVFLSKNILFFKESLSYLEPKLIATPQNKHFLCVW